ncbi:hypothetical protein PENSPDRAFT_67056 [Peniophora sp. CONT]|nr:hypothetical protein PENSPDRAFT_67056 [Peniophora sp. CONT]
MMHLSSGVQDLPDELVVEILLYLDCRNVLRCSQTCRRLHAVVNASQGMQYIIELSLTGTVDGSPTSPLTTGERLQWLRTRKQRRRLFDPVKAFSLTIDCPFGDYVYDFVDGIFAFNYVDDSTGVDISHLLAYDLSSNTESGQLLFHSRLDIVLVDFSIDPSRDLVAFSELVSEHIANPEGPDVIIHLRSLSSGGIDPPPAISKAKLEVTDDTLTEPDDIDVALAGDMVAYFSQSTLYIWRWTTGALLIHWELSTHHDWLNSFSFVSPSAFVIGESGTERGSLRLYALPSDDTTQTSLSPEDKQHTRFYLPELKSGHSAILSTHIGPFSTSSDALFPADAVLLLFVTDINNLGRVAAELSYIIRVCVFEKNLPHRHPLDPALPHSSAVSAQSVRKVRWADWGPENSRIIPYISDSMFAARGAHGSRAIISVHMDDDLHQAMAHTYFDFADARDRAFLDSRLAGTAPVGPFARAGRMRTQFRKELGGNRGVFEEAVQTSLSYHSIESIWERSEDELLLGDERIVRKIHFPDTGKLQLDVYDF